MTELSISDFKATCLAVLERVRRTGEPVLITKRGKPIAEIKPPPATPRTAWVGGMAGTITIKGDIVNEPAVPSDDWDVERS